MFTGIVEELGTVSALHLGDDDGTVTVTAPRTVAGARHGDSIAVNGVCLTVALLEGDAFVADVMPETLRRTSLRRLAVGDRVNVEAALTPQSRLGGHVVQGHVDGVGTVESREPGPRWDTIRIGLPDSLARYVAAKGSVAVDGVSLTVVDVDNAAFTVGLIPTTLAETTLGERRPGDEVNLEVDVLAKYVERLLTAPTRQGAATMPTEHVS
jgi:riboflavin synthase